MIAAVCVLIIEGENTEAVQHEQVQKGEQASFS